MIILNGLLLLLYMALNENYMFLFVCLFFSVYPSLESEEDSPIFKSRSKKRKNTDDTPYSPTGKKYNISGGNLTIM